MSSRHAPTGKLTMANADLRIRRRPEECLISIDNYNRQLVAAIENTPNYGLVVVMPDYYRVSAVTRMDQRLRPQVRMRKPRRRPGRAAIRLMKRTFDKPTRQLRKEKPR
jgi:hypothetical protein